MTYNQTLQRFARFLISCFALVGIYGLLLQTVCGQEAKPNIILVNLDDADTELLSDFNLTHRYPTLRRLADAGLRFTNLHATTPLCGPSRACLFRGQYAHNTGILVNEPNAAVANGMPGGLRAYRDQGFFANDLSTWMQDAGYRTMMVGKFMHGDFIPILPEGWDDFHSFLGAKYFDFYTLSNEVPQGKWTRSQPGKYRTVVETERALDVLDQHFERGNGQPFFLCLNPLGPHNQSGGSSMIDERYANYWRSARAPRLSNYDEADLSDKRGEFSNLRLVPPEWEVFFDSHYRDRLRATLSVDDQLGLIIRKLSEMDAMDNTYILVTSDNGFSLGQNRVFGKAYHYDHASKVPLLVFGPNVEPATANHLLAHIDLAPTIVDLAGGTTPSFVDGKSFKPLIEAPNSIAAAEWRDAILIENWETKQIIGQTICSAGNAMRRYDSVLIEHPTGDREYYDLSQDPFQLENTYDSFSVVGKSALEFQLRSLKTDRRPSVGISCPFHNETEYVGGFQLHGIADAPSGITAVRVALQDSETGKFWTGTQWLDGFRQVNAKLENRLGMIGKWSLGFQPSAENLPQGSVLVWAWSYDSVGRYSTSFFRSFRIEAGLPESKIIAPLVKSTMTSPVKFTGTAFSTDQIEHVRFTIRRASDGAYWNGADFQTDWAFVELPVEQDGSWAESVDLDPGEYFAISYAADGAGEFEETPEVNYFVVR